MAITPYATRLAETMAQIKANQVKKELSEIQVKVEFQALMVQLFLQRRYQHVLMATRFYRAVFNDGDTKLNVGKDAKDLFEKTSGAAADREHAGFAGQRSDPRRARRREGV